jgi:hypothetical protein
MPDSFARHFCRNLDGSWTCQKAGTFDGPNGRIQVSPGSTFYPGTMFMGFDLAAWLEGQYADVAEPCETGRPDGAERRHGDRRNA